MGLQVYKSLPTDQDGQRMQEFAAPFPALKVDNSENNTVSSLITLNDNCTTIEVNAVGGAAAIKWITSSNTNPSVITAAGTANFDHLIPANYFRRFAVPQETAGVPSLVGLNKRAGLYNRVAVKSVGIASVATTQY